MLKNAPSFFFIGWVPEAPLQDFVGLQNISLRYSENLKTAYKKCFKNNRNRTTTQQIELGIPNFIICLGGI